MRTIQMYVLWQVLCITKYMNGLIISMNGMIRKNLVFAHFKSPF